MNEINEAEMNKCIKLLEAGLTPQEVADIVGCTRQRVFHLRKRNEVATKRRNQSSKNKTVDEIQYSGIRDYLKDHSLFIGEFAKMFEDTYDYMAIKTFLCDARNKQITLAKDIVKKTGRSFEELFMSDEKDGTYNN